MHKGLHPSSVQHAFVRYRMTMTQRCPSLEAFKTGHLEWDLKGPDMWRTSLRAFRWILNERSRVLGSDKKVGWFTWFDDVWWSLMFLDRLASRGVGILCCIYSPRATNRGSSWSVPDMDGVIWRWGAWLTMTGPDMVCIGKSSYEHLLYWISMNFLILRYFSKSLNDSERSGWCQWLAGFWQQVRLWVQFPSDTLVQHLPIFHRGSEGIQARKVSLQGSFDLVSWWSLSLTEFRWMYFDVRLLHALWLGADSEHWRNFIVVDSKKCCLVKGASY